jgi:hypothetical protein
MRRQSSADKAMMKQAPPMLERLVAAAAMGIAFIGMASIIIPDRSRGDDGLLPPLVPRAAPAPVHGSSDDPHDGLPMLGSIEHRRMTVRIYGTEIGPRYTVEDASGGELAVLFTAERIAELFPELPLPAMEFSAQPWQGGSFQLMLAPTGE